MLRRLLNSVMETTFPGAYETASYPGPFTKKDTIHFDWLSNFAPCFPVSARNIKILKEPQEFYDTLIENCRKASERITLVSLYLGNGTMERQLVDTLLQNEHFQNDRLKVNVLIDYTRGSRFASNSRTLLQPLLQENEKNCQVSLYHTPELRGLLKKLFPNRWNELFGLQHMKLYIFDDTLIISGANLSNDYFTNRQDRYFMIKDKRLTDFYCGLVSNVQRFSLRLNGNNTTSLQPSWQHLPYAGNKSKFVEAAGDLVEEYLMASKDDENSHKQEGFDTWIFPMVQMGQLGVDQDALITNKILSEAPDGATLQIATGYFNLTTQYMDTLVDKTRARCNILMAHPTANGFLGAKGAAGGIPFAYSLIAQKFQRQSVKHRQEERINLYEYSRAGWTYHAKGLWYYPPGAELPCMTLIGSPNFGERSVRKDLETQLAVVTENEDFRRELHGECDRLYKLGATAETHRAVPAWVRVMVFLFRTYF